MLPRTTLPKLIVDGLGFKAPSATALPLSGMVNVGFDPSDVMVTLPLGLPTALGLNFTFRLADCPGVRVTGRASPLKLKPVPVALAPVIVTFEPPVFVSVSVTD